MQYESLRSLWPGILTALLNGKWERVQPVFPFEKSGRRQKKEYDYESVIQDCSVDVGTARRKGGLLWLADNVSLTLALIVS